MRFIILFFSFNIFANCDVDFHCSRMAFEGHRMCSMEYPNDVENSLGALNHLLKVKKFREVEFDIRSTKDHTPFVMHDFNACRTSRHSSAINDALFAELPKLKNKEKIPLVSQVVSTLMDYEGFLVVFDIKRLTNTSIKKLKKLTDLLSTKHEVRFIISEIKYNIDKYDNYCAAFKSIKTYKGEEVCLRFSE